MCGPIAMVLPVSRTNNEKKALQILTYHLGRLIAYCTIGFLFGLFGRGFYLAGMQQHLSIFAGVAMIVITLLPIRIFGKLNFSKPISKILFKLKSKLGKQFLKSSFKSVFTIGLLNGFLPCGMVYAAVFAALSMPNLPTSILFMAFFAIGTMPLMSGVIYLQKIATVSFRNKVQKIIPMVIVCLGIIFILRGLGLGIPYVSPATNQLFLMQEANCH
jgi:sulfite exporter TauE/SafE